MRILVTGRGTSGSWQIRGEQIGAALGATVKPRATLDDMKAADVVLVIKRVSPEMLEDLRQSGKPWVYDILDAYPQPECMTWTRDDGVRWVRSHIDRLRPNAVIWPNAQMRYDCGDGPVIYHHHRPGIEPNPIRETITTIGYEGSPQYLNGWAVPISKQARKLGASFMVNPLHLADCDVILALRHGGYVQRHWKSNVKLANAQGSGTPFIGSREQGYIETSCGVERWADRTSELHDALAYLVPQTTRQVISERLLGAAFHVEQAAEQFRAALEAV